MFFKTDSNDLLEGVADTYSAHTLHNSLEFSGILSSFLLQKRLVRGINQYYALQIALARTLYQGAMLLADRRVLEKLGEEKRGVFLRSMADYFIENSSVQIAKYLAEYEPSITPKTISAESAEDFKQDYNIVSATITLRMSNSGKSVQETVANHFMTAFLESLGYGTLVELSEEKIKDMAPTFVDMACSFFREFEKDLVSKLSVMDISKHSLT